MAENNFEIKILNDISLVANYDINLDERLKLIISIIIEKTGADACSILLMCEDNESLVLKATKGLNESAVNKTCISLDVGIVGWTAKEKKPVAVTVASKDPRFKPIQKTGEERFKSVLSVPLLAREECIGVIYTQTINEREYNEHDIRLLTVIASQLSGIIRNTQLYERSSQNVFDLQFLNEFNKEINSTLYLEDILLYTVKQSLNIVNADGSVLFVASGGDLIPRACLGLEEQIISKIKLKIGSGVVGKVVEKKEPVIIKDLKNKQDDDFLKNILPCALLCVPLTAKNKIIGVLCLIYKRDTQKREYPYFSKRDLRIISALSGQAGMAIDKAFIYEELARVNIERKDKIRELTLLYDISLAMQSTINLNKLVQIVLSCITVGDGFGFNRAMLFLVNEQSNILQGIMGLGPDSVEEARQIWSGIPKIDNLVQWLISLDDNHPKSGSLFDKFTKELRVPINRESAVLALTVIDAKPFNIKDAWNHPNVNKELLSKVGSNSFATVPIIVRDNVLGVILVDNLYTGKEITDEDVQSLVRFASYVGWAIQNRRLFSKLKEAHSEMLTIQNQLIHAEKLSAMGELAAELAHELKNPLMTVGGFARRLSEKTDLSKEEYKKYAHIISSEVARTEKLLKDILVYSRFIPTDFSENDLNHLLEDIMSFYTLTLQDRGIEITKDLSSDTAPLFVDHNRLKQVLINLVLNSMEAMPNGGRLTLKTEPLGGNPQKGVSISVRDTGGGVSPEILGNIFNPFFTTKEEGSGLGLSMSKRIVEAHGGTIDIENKVGEGVVFKINLPRNNQKLGLPLK